MRNENKQLPTLSTANTQLIKRVGTSLAITKKLLAKKGLSDAEKLAWWKGLSEQWQKIFLRKLEIDIEIFNTNPKHYLEQLFRLTELSLSENEIIDIVPLEQLVFLGYNPISDIAPLAQLSQLTTLCLYRNGISDIAPLAQLNQLTTLDLSWNQISDITPLAQLNQLTALNLWNNKISDIAPLAQLTQLSWLSLRENQISDIAPLAQLTQLTELDLDGNQIHDITPLAKLTKLKRLSLYLSQADIDWLQAKLPNCDLVYIDY